MRRNKIQSEDTEPPIVKIKPNSLVIFTPRRNYKKTEIQYRDGNNDNIENHIIKPALSPYHNLSNNKPPRQNHTNGFLSDRAGNRLRTCIKYLLWSCNAFKIRGKKCQLQINGKVTFITLTLSSDQKHSDNYIKEKMLNQFITELNRKVINLRYIWRAEKQENGNIHFHFLINRYVHYNWVQGTWNRIQDKEGYIKPYTQKFSALSFKEYCLMQKKFSIDRVPIYKKRFIAGTKSGWTSPPSCQAKGIKDAKNAIYYISKYISKNTDDPQTLSEEKRNRLKIQGHIYFCSQCLSDITAPYENLTDAMQRDLITLQELAPDAFLYEKWYTVVKLSIEQIYNLGCYHIFSLFCEGMGQLLSFNLFSPT